MDIPRPGAQKHILTTYFANDGNCSKNAQTDEGIKSAHLDRRGNVRIGKKYREKTGTFSIFVCCLFTE